ILFSVHVIPRQGGGIQVNFKMKTFPKSIFSSFFTNYFVEKSENLPQVLVRIQQLQSMDNAKNNSMSSLLRWTTICGQNPQSLFNLAPKDSCNSELWKYSVSEIFFSHPIEQHYIEHELTPYGHHLVLFFKDVRTQDTTHHQHNAD